MWLLLALLNSASAQTQPITYDGDLELVRPLFTVDDALPGIDLAHPSRLGTVRSGLVLQYQKAPLVLYEFDEELGAVINDRTSAQLGVSVDVSRAVTARFTLPMLLDFNSQIPLYASDGFAVGDAALGAHVGLLQRPGLNFGIASDLHLPTSRRSWYAGEALPRLDALLLLHGDIGRVRLATNLGARLRFRDVVTTDELLLSHELLWNGGVRVNVLPEVLDVGLTGYARLGFKAPLDREETSAEALLTVAYQPLKLVSVSLSGGRGFTAGYGATDLRVMAGVTFRRFPPALIEDDDSLANAEGNGENTGGNQFNVRDIRTEINGDGETPPEEVWEEGELARITSDRIKIRDALRFAVGTDRLLPESLKTLDFLAKLLNENALIAHVVIEGHSSEDGRFDTNYELSIDRAASIWRRLLEQGVHPSRLSYRGMGEVDPAQATGGFDELQASRRVVFEIIRQYEPWEVPPPLKTDLVYPWSGEAYRAVQPRVPGDDDELPAELRQRPERTEDDLEAVEFDDEDSEDLDFDAEDGAQDDSEVSE